MMTPTRRLGCVGQPFTRMSKNEQIDHDRLHIFSAAVTIEEIVPDTAAAVEDRTNLQPELQSVIMKLSGVRTCYHLPGKNNDHLNAHTQSSC